MAERETDVLGTNRRRPSWLRGHFQSHALHYHALHSYPLGMNRRHNQLSHRPYRSNLSDGHHGQEHRTASILGSRAQSRTNRSSGLGRVKDKFY